MNRFQALSTRLALASILILASGCGDRGDDGQAADSSEEVQRGGTVVLAELADINLPNPLLFQAALDGNLTADVMNMELLRGVWDAEEGQLVYRTADRHPMALARRYEFVGPDSTALRFHMRSDVRWSDGQPLTARDIAFTYALAKNPALSSPRADYVEHVDSVVAENDSTVTFHFRQRYPEMLTHTGIPPVAEHVYRDADPANLRTHPSVLDPVNHQVVSGPWRIGQWEKGQRIVLVPNPHFTPRPHLDQIVIRVIPEATTRLVELQTGGVDFVQNITFDQIPRLKQEAPHLRLEREEKRSYDYVAYNPQSFPAFADPEIRRALGLAVDAQGLIRALQMEEYAVPAGGPYSPIFKRLYDPELSPPVPHDPERARQILEAKGWRDTNGDGIREKDGRPFRFTLVTNSGNQRRGDATQIIQQQWRQIGVDAQLRQLEFNTFMQGLLSKNYEAALGGWVVGLSPDITGLWGADAPLNITGYQNPRVTALFDQALSQPTRQAAAPFWKQAAAEIARDQPYTWLYYFDGVDGVNQRVRGMTVNTYGPYQNTWEWWVTGGRSGRGGAAQPGAQPADSARRGG